MPGMTRNIHAVRNALLATVALLTLGATPARATPHQAIPGDWLYLTLTTGDAHTSSIRGTLLRCDPPQGHARAAGPAPNSPPPGETSSGSARPDTICSMIYGPVTASARGGVGGAAGDVLAHILELVRDGGWDGGGVCVVGLR